MMLTCMWRQRLSAEALADGDQWHCLWGHPECEQQALIDFNWSNKSIVLSSREQSVLLRLITSFFQLFSWVITEHTSTLLGLLQGVSQQQNLPLSLSNEVKTTSLLYMLPDHPHTHRHTQVHKHMYISEAPDTHTHTHVQKGLQQRRSYRVRASICGFSCAVLGRTINRATPPTEPGWKNEIERGRQGQPQRPGGHQGP